MTNHLKSFLVFALHIFTCCSFGIHWLYERFISINTGYGASNVADHWRWWSARTWRKTGVTFDRAASGLSYTWDFMQEQFWVYTSPRQVVFEGIDFFPYRIPQIWMSALVWHGESCCFSGRSMAKPFGVSQDYMKRQRDS